MAGIPTSRATPSAERVEAQHRRGYERLPPDEFETWDKVGGWPEE